jgi:L-lactate dehydrogenase
MTTDRPSKVGIVGAGSVGATIAYACMLRGVAKHISLFDVASSKVHAEVLDLNHGLMFVPKLIPDLLKVAPDAILLMVTNPVDVLTYVTLKLSGLPSERVIGSGTVLDSSRFRFLIAQRCQVAVQNVHAYIAGEHGDTEFPLWSSADIGNIPVRDWHVPGHGRLEDREQAEIFESVRTAAYQIIQGKGATNYAVGLAVSRILEAILWDEGRVLPVSSLLDDYRGVSDVCLSIPSIVNRRGIGSLLPVPMNNAEDAGLRTSAAAIRQAIRAVGF